MYESYALNRIFDEYLAMPSKHPLRIQWEERVNHVNLNNDRFMIPPQNKSRTYTESEIVFSALVPGVPKESINVQYNDSSVENIVITVNDAAKYLNGWSRSASTDGEKTVQTARTYFTLTMEDKLKIDFNKDFLVDLKDGILTIHIPLKKNSKEFVWV